MILTFDRCCLPSHVKIGWNRFEVTEYIPAPRRCFKCQGFNHSSKACHAQQSICVNCGEIQHGTECHSSPHCVNCEEAHPASDRNYFYFRLEKEILAIKSKEKISYNEAKKTALSKFVRSSTTYAQATKLNKEMVGTNTGISIPPTINIGSTTNNLKPSYNNQKIERQAPLQVVQNTASHNGGRSNTEKNTSSNNNALKEKEQNTNINIAENMPANTKIDQIMKERFLTGHSSMENRSTTDDRAKSENSEKQPTETPANTTISIKDNSRPIESMKTIPGNTILRNIPTILTSNNEVKDDTAKAAYTLISHCQFLPVH